MLVFVEYMPPYVNIMYQTRIIREARVVHDYIKERTLKIGLYILETRNTVRTIAKEFGVSKSTVHKDLTERLPEINPDLANEVKEILEYHKSVRHLRGGEATKVKYKQNGNDNVEEEELAQVKS
jgi:putative DeoR family transcriptional regulator (stage III sporulation protein D)